MQLYSHEYFMRQALQQAELAFEADEVPVGAIVVIENKVIARAHNQTETLTDSTAHAEMIALTAAFYKMGSKQLPAASIYITLEPCLMCCGALFWARPAQIIYGATDEKFGYHRFTGQAETKPYHPKTNIVAGVLANEAAALLKQFFKSKRD